jgi:peptidoglycan hydrolase-like protein with peptidoglycan-binding domain
VCSSDLKAKPAASPAAQTEAQLTFYDAMVLSDRIALQSDLAWSGDYNGLANGDFGNLSIAAVKAFQKRQGNPETGILNPQERAKLATFAKSRQDNVGWRTVTDPATGARVGMPSKLVPQPVAAKSGSRWESAHGDVRIETFRDVGATLAAVFNREKADPSRKIDYSVLKPDFFVIAGLQGLKLFYMRGEAKGDEVRGVAIMHDQAIDGIMAPVVVAMSSAFNPFPTDAPRPASRRLVDYASGVVISGTGDIVSDREATEGCETIVVAGIGNAERIAADEASGLALLHVFGARSLKPLALAASQAGSDVTVVGIADPQLQAGGAGVSSAKLRLQSGAAIESPAQGFAGGAAIDPGAGFVGVVTQSPQAAQTTIAPVEKIRALLGTKSIVPTTGRADVDAAKGSVVRVICVRK